MITIVFSTKDRNKQDGADRYMPTVNKEATFVIPRIG